MAVARHSVIRPWLVGWKGIQATDAVALEPSPPGLSLHEALEALTKAGYLVHIEQVDTQYRVRCLYTKPEHPFDNWQLNLSYCGDALDRILDSAAYEMDILSTDPQEAQSDSKERFRWVVS